MELTGKPDLRINFKKADSKNKEFAFMKANELNNTEKLIQKECSWCKGKGCEVCHGYGHVYEKVAWRVGKNTSQQLIVEIDSHDPENLKSVHTNLENLFGYKFNIAKTKHGFHLIGNFAYTAAWQWEHANCLVLNNTLKLQDYQEYKNKVIELDMNLRNQLYTTDYKTLFADAMKFNGLLNCVGEFDILYTMLSLKFGKSTLRISKKSKDDKYEEVNI